jgi:single-strand DNA-binding protein|nr:MAG TPA: Single strand binding protein [Caudoviricetes sp.]
MSINRVAISGNLTRDPELRQTAGGMAILGFGVAVNDRHKNQQTGEWEDYPNFIDCAMFGSRAEKLQPYLAKGTKVAIDGKLRWSQWERDGQKRSKVEVIVDEIEFMSRQQGQLGSKPVHAAAAPAQPMQPVQPMQLQFGGMPAPQQAAPSIYDDDIPF